MESSATIIQVEPGLAPCTRTFTYQVVKRLMDCAVALCVLIVFSPVLAAIAVIIKLTSPGPVFYRWDVVGRGGQPLTGYKFRTMVINADQIKEDIIAQNERKGPTFKMKRDPRITSVGRFLRKFSLDELPQLWSVIKGDMSLVGPRPMFLHEWQQLEGWQRRKLSVTPGMVCLWHVRGTSATFDEWIRFDFTYVDNWSLWLDIQVLFGTALYVLSGRNY